jgi:hypothetical protein
VPAKIASTIAAAIIAAVCAGASSSASVESDHAALTLDLRGRIAPACAIDLQARADVGELSEAGDAAVPLSINCNHRLRYALRSQNGGMQHLQQADYIVPYTARLELNGPRGASGHVVRSRDMRAHAALDDLGREPPFAQNGRLLIHWDAPRQQLVQGDYQDVLTITVVMEGQ